MASKDAGRGALSTSEADYIAVIAAACQVVWLRRLVAYFNYKPSCANEIFCYNRYAIAMTNKTTFLSRTQEHRHSLSL